MKKTRLRDRKKKFYKAWQKALGAYWKMKKDRDDIRKQLTEAQAALASGERCFARIQIQRNALQARLAKTQADVIEWHELKDQLAASQQQLVAIRDWVRRQPGCPQDAEIQVVIREIDDKLWIDVVSETLAGETWKENDCADPLWNQYNLITLSELLTLRNQLAKAVTKRHEGTKENGRMDEQELIAIEEYYGKQPSEIAKSSAIQDIHERLLPALKACQQELAEAETQLLDEQGNAAYWKGLARGKTANILRKKEEIATLRAEIASREKAHKEAYPTISALRAQLAEAQKAIRIAHGELPDDEPNAKETLGSYMNIHKLEEW